MAHGDMQRHWLMLKILNLKIPNLKIKVKVKRIEGALHFLEG